jgi:thiopeptide-type bacteriocin biosynthesis protein
MRISSQGFFLLRRPQLPLDVFQAFHQKINGHPELFEEEMIRFVSQPAILEAIYVASPELYDSFTGVLEGRVKTGVDKLMKSLYKYLVRMTARSTPYGLFAGCALGELGPETRIAFRKDDPHYTHARLDMNYVAEMVSGLVQKSNIYSQLKFYPNNSLYKIGTTYRYVEGSVKNKKRQYVLSAVESSEYLDIVIELAKSGATVAQLADSLMAPDITQEEAARYIDMIIESQILVSEMDATVTGDEFFNVVVKKLEGMEGTEEDTRHLREIGSLLKLQEVGVTKYRQIESIISEHFVTTGSKDLVQTDLFYETESCVLNEQVVDTLTKEFTNISCLGYRNQFPETDQFRRAFYERFEEREVPLLMALDNEAGVGYGHITAGKADNLPLLDEMYLPSVSKPGQTDWTPVVKFKEKIYQNAIAEGSNCVHLTDDMLNALRKDIPVAYPLPDSFYLFGSLIAPSQQAMDAGDFQFAFHAMGGPSGLKLIGRFCHGNPALTELTREASREEEMLDPDAIFAEIAHLPEARVGNVLMRPHFREYEIPYLAGSSLPAEKQILPSDLMVSVPGGKEIVLRSKSLNKRVYPRLTNAHNFAAGLPVYRFLCDLAYQHGNQYFNWNWSFLGNNAFLPRVQYKHWILTKATWNLEKGDFTTLLTKEPAYVQEWQQLRQARGIPQWVCIRQGDNELLIDGESEISIQILCDAMRKYGKISISEFVDTPGQTMLNVDGRGYVNEVLIPLLQKKEKKEAVAPAIAKPDLIRRQFMVGSEWLYIKIYAGTKTADRLLTSTIKPFTERLLEKGLIEKWFYLRYADPEEHLRIRFNHSSRPGFWNEVLHELNQLLQPLLEDGIVLKLQIDTYKRELERYGQHSFPEIETVFFADSVATINLLDLLGGDEGERYRWLIGLRSVHSILDDMNFTLPEKKELMDALQERFFKEFNGNTQLTVQLNNKYRAHTKDITSFMNAADDEVNEMNEAVAILNERSARIKQVMGTLLPGLEVSRSNLAASLVHMFLNRLFVSKQRVHELVVYHYLKKYYESTLARAKTPIKKTVEAQN